MPLTRCIQEEPPPPPHKTTGTIVGNNEIYNRENLMGPYFGTQTFGSQTPQPPSALVILPCGWGLSRGGPPRAGETDRCLGGWPRFMGVRMQCRRCLMFAVCCGRVNRRVVKAVCHFEDAAH